jgi:hypothetical protein
MSQKKADPDRFVGLDVHKHYLIAAAVDADRNEVMSPRRVPLMLVASILTLSARVFVVRQPSRRDHDTGRLSY